jgi:hypothetical protein
MSRRTNILLVIALATGAVYGWLGVPFLLPLVSDDIQVAEDDLARGLSPVEELIFQMEQLRSGMVYKPLRKSEVGRVLGLASFQCDGCFSSGNTCITVYTIDSSHRLFLTIHLDSTYEAVLYDGNHVELAHRFVTVR